MVWGAGMQSAERGGYTQGGQAIGTVLLCMDIWDFMVQ